MFSAQLDSTVSKKVAPLRYDHLPRSLDMCISTGIHDTSIIPSCILWLSAAVDFYFFNSLCVYQLKDNNRRSYYILSPDDWLDAFLN